MQKKYLVILEISQKQAYIFQYKRLVNNIFASDLIEYVTSSGYFEKEAGEYYNNKKNMVYQGGGHTVLEFASKEEAREFVKRITRAILKQFDGLEIFAKIEEYQTDKTPPENETNLIKALEEKKSRRRASFHQGRFGVEKMNGNKKETSLSEKYKEKLSKSKPNHNNKEKDNDIQNKNNNQRKEQIIDYNIFSLAGKFESLGGSKNESNFIAVIHIDGNLMGKRVAGLVSKEFSRYSEISEKTETGWQNYKTVKAGFSKRIDEDFKASLYEMFHIVEKNYKKGNLESLGLKKDKKEKILFPVRRIIAAGDDICFVTEGRIGLECAAAYLNAIWKKENNIDHKNYSACAGVAIVHQKYPFYKAYELAEELCSNAKKFIASLDENASANVCAIDWHIEYGEMENGLSNIRQQYITTEGNHMEMRPYIVCGDEKLLEKEKIRRYTDFKQLVQSLKQDDAIAARGKMKSLRTVLKNDEQTAVNYLKSNLMEDTAWKARDCYRLKETNQSEKLFYTTYDEEKRNILFDALEIMDTFVALEEE